MSIEYRVGGKRTRVVANFSLALNRPLTRDSYMLLFISLSLYYCLSEWTGAVPAEYFSVQKRKGYDVYMQTTSMIIPWFVSAPGATVGGSGVVKRGRARSKVSEGGSETVVFWCGFLTLSVCALAAAKTNHQQQQAADSNALERKEIAEVTGEERYPSLHQDYFEDWTHRHPIEEENGR